MAKDPALEQQWRERLKRHAVSGLTIKAFCEQEGVPTARFSWWQRELKRRDGSVTETETKPIKSVTKPTADRKPARGSFVPVEVAPAMPTSAVEIVLDDPPRIAVTAGFDPKLLADVLRVLEDRSC